MLTQDGGLPRGEDSVQSAGLHSDDVWWIDIMRTLNFRLSRNDLDNELEQTGFCMNDNELDGIELHLLDYI